MRLCTLWRIGAGGAIVFAALHRADGDAIIALASLEAWRF